MQGPEVFFSGDCAKRILNTLHFPLCTILRSPSFFQRLRTRLTMHCPNKRMVWVLSHHHRCPSLPVLDSRGAKQSCFLPPVAPSAKPETTLLLGACYKSVVIPVWPWCQLCSRMQLMSTLGGSGDSSSNWVPASPLETQVAFLAYRLSLGKAHCCSYFKTESLNGEVSVSPPRFILLPFRYIT